VCSVVEPFRLIENVSADSTSKGELGSTNEEDASCAGTVGNSGKWSAVSVALTVRIRRLL